MNKIQLNSADVKAKTLYSTSVDDLETIGWRLAHHETKLVLECASHWLKEFGEAQGMEQKTRHKTMRHEVVEWCEMVLKAGEGVSRGINKRSSY